MVKVICINNYNDLVLNRHVNKNEELEVDINRAKVLVDHNVARIVQEEIIIPEQFKEIKVEATRPLRRINKKK